MKPSGIRWGFTTIELMVVLMLAAIIVTAAVPAIMPALRKNAVNRAAASILAVADQARRLARSSMDSTNLYGVLVNSTDGTVAITQGGAIFNDTDTGQPIMKRSLGGNATVYTSWDSTATPPFGGAADVSWSYAAQTGVVVTAGGVALEVGSGSGAAGDPYANALNLVSTKPAMMSPAAPPNVIAPVATPAQFGVCTLDGQYGVGIIIYHIGIGYSREVVKPQ